jgi:hypothetical protein
LLQRLGGRIHLGYRAVQASNLVGACGILGAYPASGLSADLTEPY